MILGDRYRLDRELGKGGAATVWLAEDLAAGARVAVKVLDASTSVGRGERLEREARLLSSLRHDHVVRVHDVGEHEGRPYIVMELLEGGSLAERVEREGPLRPEEAVRALLPVLDALGKAHELGIVHRDVKPANLLLRATGEVVLCDFGIARADDGDTRTGVALGSIGYMAPEQRLDARRVGPPADVYGAACALFNLVTADTPVDLYLAPDHSPRWDSVPAPLRPVLRRATRSEPSARQQTMAELVEDLGAVLPALHALPAVRSRVLEPPVGYVPTRFDEPEPTPSAERRERLADREAWGWAGRTAPVGRSAMWVGAALVVVASGVALTMGPLAERVLAEVAAPPPAEVPPLAPPAVEGEWVGVVGDSRVRLTLVSGGALAGEVRVGEGEGRIELAGGVEGDELVLVERAGERPGTWRARLGATGLVLEGTRGRPGEAPLPFAVVRAPRQ